MTAEHPQNTVNVSTFIPEGYVFVPFLPENERDVAVKLIQAAGELYGSVMAQSGGFLAPAAVVEAAGLDGVHAAPSEVPPAPAPVEVSPEVPAGAPSVTDAPAEPDPTPAPAKKAAKAAAADDAPAGDAAGA